MAQASPLFLWKEQSNASWGPDNIDYEEPDDDSDIDVCLGCGRHYGFTQSLEDKWRENYNPRSNEIMPQLCFNCM